MAQVEMGREKFIPRCIKHAGDLPLLLFRDCNCPMCSDCGTCNRSDHVGHNLCKVSEVAEFHQNNLERVLNSSDTMSLQENTRETNQSGEKIRRSHLQNFWKGRWNQTLEQTIDRNTLRERRGLSIKHDESVIIAFQFSIQFAYLHIEVERLLPLNMESIEEGNESDE